LQSQKLPVLIKAASDRAEIRPKMDLAMIATALPIGAMV
jgi:hypothetical protein